MMKINLETITPLWTGDAWGKNTEIKPQSIMGALRFWFEVYCHAVGIPVKSYENEGIDSGKFQESLKSALREEADLDKAEDTALAEQNIFLPSRIFGCTGWKGLIAVKSIKVQRDCGFNDYGQGKFCVSGHNAGWYFPRKSDWFFGNLQITFVSHQTTIKNIIVPLLNFIQQYGFIGGKNNLGYGRVKFTIDGEDIEENVFGFSHFRKQDKEYLGRFDDTSVFDAIQEMSSFNELLNCKRIGLWKCKKQNNSASLENIIKFLIKYKAAQRVMENDRNVRHYKFGSTYRDEYYVNHIHDETHKISGPNATKMVPWINETDDGSYEYGFLSLVGLQTFGLRTRLSAVKKGTKEKRQ